MSLKKCEQNLFKIFLIFITRIKKDLIIKELEKRKGELGIKGSVKIFYKKFEPHVIPLGEFYMFLLKKKIKTRTLKKTIKTKHSKSSKTKGGFLFMLTDKGKEPITGDDVKKMMEKYNKAFGLLYYTRYGQDSTVVKDNDGEIKADLAQPYTALQAILAASSKDLYGIAMNRGMDIFSLLQNTSEIFNIREYYNLYKLYMREYYKSEALHDPELKKKMEIATRLSKGPPPEPTYISGVLDFVGTDKKSVYANVNMDPEQMTASMRRRTVMTKEDREATRKDWKDWREGKGKYATGSSNAG